MTASGSDTTAQRDPCPRGTYCTKGLHMSCTPCPADKTTPIGNKGAIGPEDYTIPRCPPGTFLPSDSTNCTKCLWGFYQPLPQQSGYLSCAPDTSTNNVGSESNILISYKVCIRSKTGVTFLKFRDKKYAFILLAHVCYLVFWALKSMPERTANKHSFLKYYWILNEF